MILTGKSRFIPSFRPASPLFILPSFGEIPSIFEQASFYAESSVTLNHHHCRSFFFHAPHPEYMDFPVCHDGMMKKETSIRFNIRGAWKIIVFCNVLSWKKHHCWSSNRQSTLSMAIIFHQSGFYVFPRHPGRWGTDLVIIKYFHQIISCFSLILDLKAISVPRMTIINYIVFLGC